MNKCECGCGRECNKRFVVGHSGKGVPRSPEEIAKFKKTLSDPEVKARQIANTKAGWTADKKDHHRKINLGKTLDQEHRNKIGKGNSGKVRTDEHREVYSKLNKGKRIGEANTNWKGGTSRIYKNGYYSPEYLDWRKKVFERDNYTCQHCSIRGGKYLTAHHIKSFAKFPELRFDLNNGITLCEDCHCKVDSYRARFKKKQH